MPHTRALTTPLPGVLMLCVVRRTDGARVKALNVGMNNVKSRANGTSERKLPGDSVQRENLLLATLPDAERRRLLAACESVELRFGSVLCKQRTRIRHVYFPTGSVISLLAQLDGRPGLEVGLVGAEGAVGIALALGVSTAPVSLIVQGSGSALRIEAARFGAELDRSPTLRDAMSRYLYVFMSQLAAMAPCARFHMVEARLARWLLMTRDRAASDDFYLTQEFIAYMLGVRRVGVTRAARVLRARRLVSYSRGYINILDGPGLEAASCSCYATGRDTYARFMRPTRKRSRPKAPAPNLLRIPS
jgi:CRP-like cAMP-binding protein